MSAHHWQPAVDPDQSARDRRFGRWSQRVVVIVLVLAVGALVTEGSWRSGLGVTVVTAVILLPFLRVMWLLAIWVRQRDRRFIWCGIALLTMIVAGIAVAALRGR